MKSYALQTLLVLAASMGGCGKGDSSTTPESPDSFDGAVDGTDDAVALDTKSTGLDSGTTNVDQAVADVPTDEQTCSTLDSSCGGTIVGTWHVVSTCSTSPVSLPACTQPGLSTDRSKSDTAYAFRTDGTFTYISSGAIIETTRYPAECLGSASSVGLAQACANFEANLRLRSTGTDTYACAVDENQLCACKHTTTIADMKSGTYATNGATISFSVKAISDLDGGAIDAGTIFTGFELPTTYCVSRDTLILQVRGLTGAVTRTTLRR